MAAIDKEVVDLLKKGAIEVCLHTPGEFISNIFTVPKKSGGNRPVIDMRALIEFVEYNPFQNGRHIPAKICSQTGRFYDKTRFKGCISNCPSEQKIKNLPSLHLEGCTLPIHLPPFRSLFLRQNFHQGYETSDCISKGHGDQIINFSRGHINHGKLSRACNSTHNLVTQVLTSLGFVINFPKSILIPSKVLPYLGFKVNSDLMKLFLPRENL